MVIQPLNKKTGVGLKGAFGKVFMGMHDTPTKKAQGKVDLFNDTTVI